MRIYLTLLGLALAIVGHKPSFAGDISTSISDNSVKHSMLYQAVEKYADTTLSTSDVDTLNATPVSVLAASGSGYVNVVTGAVFWVVHGSSAFELGSGVLDLKYTNSSGAKVVTSVLNATVESSSDAVSYSPGIVVIPVDNAAVVAHTTTDVTDVTSAGKIKVRVFYKVVPTNYLAAY